MFNSSKWLAHNDAAIRVNDGIAVDVVAAAAAVVVVAAVAAVADVAADADCPRTNSTAVCYLNSE